MDRDPRQLELFPEESAPERMYRQFSHSLLGKLDNSQQAAIDEMRIWVEVHDLPLVANWVRRTLRALGHAGQAPEVLETFGYAFRGDVVGAIGRDLLTGPLQAADPDYREAAVNVLCLWLQYDEDGMWLDMAERHLETEDNEELRYRINLALNVAYGDEELVLEDDEEDDVELEEYWNIRYRTKTEVEASMPVLEIPAFLEKMIKMPMNRTLGLLETLKIGKVCVQDPTLGLDLGPEIGHCVLKVWDLKGNFALSLEPQGPNRITLNLYY